jgi:hypothetical protein
MWGYRYKYATRVIPKLQMYVFSLGGTVVIASAWRVEIAGSYLGRFLNRPCRSPVGMHFAWNASFLLGMRHFCLECVIFAWNASFLESKKSSPLILATSITSSTKFHQAWLNMHNICKNVLKFFVIESEDFVRSSPIKVFSGCVWTLNICFQNSTQGKILFVNYIRNKD